MGSRKDRLRTTSGALNSEDAHILELQKFIAPTL